MATTFVGERSDFRDETIYFAMTTRFYDGDPKNNVCTWTSRRSRLHQRPRMARRLRRSYREARLHQGPRIHRHSGSHPWCRTAPASTTTAYHAMDMSSVDLRYESRTEWGSENGREIPGPHRRRPRKGPQRLCLTSCSSTQATSEEANLNPSSPATRTSATRPTSNAR